MSDMMNTPRPPMSGMPPTGGNAIEQNRSILNPQDATMLGQQGKLGPNMNVGGFLKDILKIPEPVLDQPMTTLVNALKNQGANATPQGKMQAMAGRPPMGGQPPGGMPPPVQPQGGGLADLKAKLGQ